MRARSTFSLGLFAVLVFASLPLAAAHGEVDDLFGEVGLGDAQAPADEGLGKLSSGWLDWNPGSVVPAEAALPAFEASTIMSDVGTVADWFKENFEVHGFLRSRFYVRSPNFSNQVKVNSLRSELNLEPELRIFENDDWLVSFYAVIRPTYEAAYDMRGDFYGERPNKAPFGTGNAFPDNDSATRSSRGQRFLVPDCASRGPGQFCGNGGRNGGEASILNSDTGSLFNGKLVPAIAIDDVVFFGRVTAPVATNGPNQDPIGGNATGRTYEDLRDNFGQLIPGVPAGPFGGNALQNGGVPIQGRGLDASLSSASRSLRTPFNFYAGEFQNQTNFEQSPADINQTVDNLRFDCFDHAQPYCMFREFYLDVEWKDTFIRFGRQQIVWGKTDAFRLQDVINPIDFSIHNVVLSLEDRRIPVLALDLIHSFGDIGPFQDVNFEVAWVWDEFIPDQFGQCGEPWAFTAACEARADAGGHQLFNFSLQGVNKRTWKIGNTQPGVRVEFRIPEPSIAFSISAFYGFQKIPVARFSNFYSVDNPNPAGMLFQQGIADPSFAANPLAGVGGCPNYNNPLGNLGAAIDCLASVSPTYSGDPLQAGNIATSTGVWLVGFDPYATVSSGPNRGQALGTRALANNDLQTAWGVAASPCFALDGSQGRAGRESRECLGANAVLALPWTASEATLQFPRVWQIGASLDYQIPKIDTILRIEMAGDLGAQVQNTNRASQIDETNIFKMAVGLDRSTFIPFVNPNRTAFLSAQVFVEHITDYDGSRFGADGTVPYETNIITTGFMENYWRNDSIIATTLFAIDWKSKAVVFAPKGTYVFNDNIRFEAGINLFWGDGAFHNLRDLCADGTTNCANDPSSWQQGQWQLLNGPARRASQAPFWGRQSFADRFMRRRDEFWFGATYQW